MLRLGILVTILFFCFIVLSLLLESYDLFDVVSDSKQFNGIEFLCSFFLKEGVTTYIFLVCFLSLEVENGRR